MHRCHCRRSQQPGGGGAPACPPGIQGRSSCRAADATRHAADASRPVQEDAAQPADASRDSGAAAVEEEPDWLLHAVSAGAAEAAADLDKLDI